MVLLATSNSFSTYRAARLHDQSGRAVSTNASSEELLYNVGPTQCQEVCVNLQMDAAAPPPMSYAASRPKEASQRAYLLPPMKYMTPISWWDMQDLIVYSLLWIGGPSMSLTYRIYDDSWGSLLTCPEVHANWGLWCILLTISK